MLDTDTCVFITRQNRPRVAHRFRQQRRGDLGISVITYGELHLGAQKSDRPSQMVHALDQFAEIVTVLPLEEGAGRHYAQLRANLEQRGQIIGNNDLWIAAHCLQLGLTLVTNNEREFSRIPNLTIENWTH
jgi:tRNA(fMet)-specific endonuclease VapC